MRKYMRGQGKWKENLKDLVIYGILKNRESDLLSVYIIYIIISIECQLTVLESPRRQTSRHVYHGVYRLC